MLMFIPVRKTAAMKQPSFNTSYVNVYLIQEAQNVFCCVRFNTSYVNVYQDKEVCVLEPSCGFQYILC